MWQSKNSMKLSREHNLNFFLKFGGHISWHSPLVKHLLTSWPIRFIVWLYASLINMWKLTIVRISKGEQWFTFWRFVNKLPNWVFFKCFRWICWIQWQNICHYSKKAQTCHPATSCVTDQDAITGPARHMWETGSLNWAHFMLRSLVSTYVVCERLSVMHKQVSVHTVNFCPNSQEHPVLEFGSRIPPPPPRPKLKFRQILALWVFHFRIPPPPKEMKFRQILALWVFDFRISPPQKKWNLGRSWHFEYLTSEYPLPPPQLLVGVSVCGYLYLSYG